jgi:hypothetical protein
MSRGAFAAAMTDESTEPRTQDVKRLMLSLPLRTQQERVTSAQTMYDALIRMVDVADRDLMSHWLTLIPWWSGWSRWSVLGPYSLGNRWSSADTGGHGR